MIGSSMPRSSDRSSFMTQRHAARSADLEDLIEKITHCAPRAPVGSGVIGEARNIPSVNVTVGEAVPHASIEVHLPIDSRTGHLRCEGVALLGCDDGILVALTDEHFAANGARILRCRRREAGMKADGTSDFRAAAGKLQHGGAAKAEADRAYSRRVDSR